MGLLSPYSVQKLIRSLYEISEEELLTIERGSPDSIYLTIAIALLSFALAIFCSLLVTEIKSTVSYDRLCANSYCWICHWGYIVDFMEKNGKFCFSMR
jgi:hypothetical protein